ncbi:MAG: hypothetical protein A3B10_00190 [Candidatus Doudnabacteria bacterium RIFCSPLOWO2_01_FULL_44_21]|uniref:Bacterial spore germination immunoglobulin-like domain-containing protein n=1 Tax=Candidatus Doudnabacteria bacterium RIFCSPLOWO2_01_FULL_44_21 TaxID=1817841 RepID=A0A1F5PXI7_9BACT|nr:MAG: hypothetical protein A3B95_03645 [Candidatus Doudnabacteria bacterium RIFCSPHIGHO2_02_FULL_43_13b]OGE94567.1 MAG: hypothetical protein A3B10_00190 [Candidatus Doudnabacteria bacterium RIFCSPLOWO2_01_FULL_44_21]
MNKYIQGIILLILVVAAIFLIPKKQEQAPPTQVTDQQPQAIPEVIVDTPQPNDVIISPVTVTGRARGFWYFEANLPVTLKDGNGNVLAQKGFQAIGDWMTTDHVDFSDTLIFITPATQYGTLIISKDNPSGEPINDADFVVPIRFW